MVHPGIPDAPSEDDVAAVGVSPGNDEPNVFGFRDYRAYLKAFYEARRQASSIFSYRFMAQRLDVDAGQLSRILQGRLHLPQRAVAATIRLCRLGGRQAAYFEELMRLARAKTPEEEGRSLERLSALETPAARETEIGQADYYSRWHHSVVRALASLESIPQDPSSIARSCLPALSSEAVAESLALLERCGLLRRDPSGRLVPDEPHIAPHRSVRPELLRAWHAQAMDQARKALADTPASERDVSTMTVAVDAAALDLVREWIADLRRQARALSASSCEPDKVFQVNVQWFPVGRRGKGRAAG